MNEYSFDILPAFTNLLNNDSRYLLLYGGAGSGKSHFAYQKTVLRCLNSKHTFLYARKVKDTLWGSCFHHTIKILDDIRNATGCDSLYKVTERPARIQLLTTGSEIIGKGLDDEEKIKSLHGITGIVCEELSEFDKTDFDQLDLRLREPVPYYKQIIGMFNPISERHWLKQFISRNLPNVTTHHSTYLVNTAIDREEYRQVLENQVGADENMRRIYLRGEWGRMVTGQEYYNTFKYDTHVKGCLYDTRLPLHVTFDQNVVPYNSGLCFQVERLNDIYEVRILREVALKNPNNTTEHVCNNIKDFYRDIGTLYYYGDASGNKRSTLSNDTDYTILRRVFRQEINNTSDRTMRINPPHKKRRRFIQDLFSGKLSVRVLIHPSCKLLIEDLETVKEDADGGTLKEKLKDRQTGQTYEPYGHLSDAFCYGMIALFQQQFNRY